LPKPLEGAVFREISTVQEDVDLRKGSSESSFVGFSIELHIVRV
jgi:hypothetical protein